MMTHQPITVFEDIKLEEALQLMEDRPHPLNMLPVLKRDGSLYGLFRLHDAYEYQHCKSRELNELDLRTEIWKQEKNINRACKFFQKVTIGRLCTLVFDRLNPHNNYYNLGVNRYNDLHFADTLHTGPPHGVYPRHPSLIPF